MRKLTDIQSRVLAALSDGRGHSTAQVTYAVFDKFTPQQRAKGTISSLVRRGLVETDVEKVRGFQKRSWHYLTEAGRKALETDS